MAAQVVGALAPFLRWRRREVGGEGGEGSRCLDALAGRQAADVLFGDTAIEPGRGARRASQPIDHDVVEQQVHREAVERVAAAVAPSLEFLDDPGGESDR